MNDTRIDYGSWLFRMVAWDGLFPVVVLTVPMVVQFLFPKQRDAILVPALSLPIAGFFVRMVVGSGYIESNHCGKMLRRLQGLALFCGAMLLVVIDCLLILAREIDLFTAEDEFVWVILISIYLTLMLIAMYPGRSPVVEDDWNDYSTSAENRLEIRPSSEIS